MARKPRSATRRQTTGVTGSLDFKAGTPVVGQTIKLSDGTTFSNCYLADPKMGGTVTNGVVRPWDTEVAQAKACN